MDRDELVNVYWAADLFEAEFLENLLANAGVSGRVTGNHAIQAAAATASEPCLLVRRSDEAAARQLLAEWEAAQARRRAEIPLPDATWNCPGCGEAVESNFDLCWNCQTPRDESGDPALPGSNQS